MAKPVASMQLLNLPDLKRDFEKLARYSESKADAAVHAGSLEIRNAAQEKAPYLTGTLRRSINEERASDTDSSEIAYDIGTDVVYAAAQEFGYAGIPAHPYLRPALDEKGQQAVDTIRDSVKRLLEGL